MSVAKIQSALAQAFLATGLFPETNIQQENVEFEAVSGEPWAALYFFPGQPTVATLGQHGDDRFDGFLQIDVNFPTNSGAGAALAMGDSLRTTFTAGARLSYSGQEVVIVNCGCSQGRIVNGFYRVSVTVVFYAFVTR